MTALGRKRSFTCREAFAQDGYPNVSNQKERATTPPKWFLAASLAIFFAGGAIAGGRFVPIALLDQIKPGVTTERQVLDLLGPSPRTIDYPRRGLRDLQYETVDYGDFLDVVISVGNDGVVRDVAKMKHQGL